MRIHRYNRSKYEVPVLCRTDDEIVFDNQSSSYTRFAAKTIAPNLRQNFRYLSDDIREKATGSRRRKLSSTWSWPCRAWAWSRASLRGPPTRRTGRAAWWGCRGKGWRTGRGSWRASPAPKTHTKHQQSRSSTQGQYFERLLVQYMKTKNLKSQGCPLIGGARASMFLGGARSLHVLRWSQRLHFLRGARASIFLVDPGGAALKVRLPIPIITEIFGIKHVGKNHVHNVKWQRQLWSYFMRLNRKACFLVKENN